MTLLYTGYNTMVENSMSHKTVDARGLPCPKPIIMAKKTLAEDDVDSFELILDNETSKDNVERFLVDNNISFRTEQSNGIFTLSVRADNVDITNTSVEPSCPVPEEQPVKGTTTVCISGSTMGDGDEELGTVLMKGFVQTLKQCDPLPDKIILYNGGVLLAATDNPVHASLLELEIMGITVLVCGTCADYYDIKKSLALGTVSNMYEIVESLNSAARIIYP